MHEHSQDSPNAVKPTETHLQLDHVLHCSFAGAALLDVILPDRGPPTAAAAAVGAAKAGTTFPIVNCCPRREGSRSRVLRVLWGIVRCVYYEPFYSPLD